MEQKYEKVLNEYSKEICFFTSDLEPVYILLRHYFDSLYRFEYTFILLFNGRY